MCSFGLLKKMGSSFVALFTFHHHKHSKSQLLKYCSRITRTSQCSTQSCIQLELVQLLALLGPRSWLLKGGMGSIAVHVGPVEPLVRLSERAFWVILVVPT